MHGEREGKGDRLKGGVMRGEGHRDERGQPGQLCGDRQCRKVEVDMRCQQSLAMA
jgi:hypothetical protein